MLGEAFTGVYEQAIRWHPIWSPEPPPVASVAHRPHSSNRRRARRTGQGPRSGRPQVDEVLPEVPVREWVCSLPWATRCMLAFDPALCAEVLAVFMGALSRSLRWRAKRTLGLRSVEDALVGAVTVIQRSDGALRVNPHFHTIALDGVYVRVEEGELVSPPCRRRAPRRSRSSPRAPTRGSRRCSSVTAARSMARTMRRRPAVRHGMTAQRRRDRADGLRRHPLPPARPGASLLGTRGEVSASVIGINIQEPAYDLAASLTDVAFEGNERNVDGMFLPLPDPGLSADR